VSRPRAGRRRVRTADRIAHTDHDADHVAHRDADHDADRDADRLAEREPDRRLTIGPRRPARRLIIWMGT